VTAAASGARALVAGQLERLAAVGGPLASSSARDTMELAQHYTPGGLPTRARRRFRRDVLASYLDRQPEVPREGKAALLTAGPPGAGKSTALDELGLVMQGWRRLDADVVKDYLVADIVRSGYYDDLLSYQLADGQPILPAELASLTHRESVSILDDIRQECLRHGENILIEGTLSWAAYGAQLLGELVNRDYQDVTIVDVEVPVELARERALQRWWDGRQERIATGQGLGGRFTPASLIARAFPDPNDQHSVCAANARALFDSEAGSDFAVITLTVHDSTSGRLVIDTQQRRAGKLQP